MKAFDVLQAAPEEWDRLVQRFPAYTVFHSLAWLRALEQSYPIRLFLLTLIRDNTCVAAWPVFEQRIGPLRIVGSPLPGWATVYLGPLFSADVDIDDAIASFMNAHPLKRAAYTYCKVMEEGRGVNLKPYGFVENHAYKTYLLDLTADEKDLWRNLKKGCKSSTRKAMKAGVEVRVEEDDDFLQDFWKMSVEVYAKSGIKPNYSLELLQNLWRLLSETKSVLVFSAFKDSQRIASLFLPCTKDTMYYWAGASYRKRQNLCPNNLLQWDAILHAKKCGIQCYDMVSIYGSAGRFKRSFGGAAHTTATHWERYRYPWIRWAKIAYGRWLRQRARIQ